MTPEIIDILQYGGGAGFSFLLIKVILEFLTSWRATTVNCVSNEQWTTFLEKFSEHHQEDKRLLDVVKTLEVSIQSQTQTNATMVATLKAQQDVLNQIAMDLRARN